MRVARCGRPVIVVGNLSVGGTGKTPLVVWLAACLGKRGYRPGIATRGYGGEARDWPQEVWADSDPVMVGDEPVLLARRVRCPVMAGPDRSRSARILVDRHGCDVVVCDDGLQHLALHRDIEIAVVDGLRGLGNGRLLPAGPLREPVSRLGSIDLLVVNGEEGRAALPDLPADWIVYPMRCRALSLCPLQGGDEVPATAWRGQAAHAVAGIGHPERFFATLKALGIAAIRHPFPDHHRFSPGDIAFGDGLPVIMTEKDAVKCRRYAGPEHWYLPIASELPPEFEHSLFDFLWSSPHG
jgi:tetraacyldisaccharide 4'-kinase